MTRERPRRGSGGEHPRRAQTGKSIPHAPCRILVLLLLAASAAITAIMLRGRSGIRGGTTPKATALRAAPTFSKDVAPIVFNRCSFCHRPDQSAPFALLTHEDVRKRAKQIAEVIGRGEMPPWPPEPGYGEFAGSRRLTAAELETIQRWISSGAAEGDPADLPTPPRWPDGWELGAPDLVVTPPEPYRLAAEGKDVYHNLVLPVPTTARRYVRAVELQPGNPRVVHHASILVDATHESRRLAEKQTPPGFDGMQLPESAATVAGQMLGWEPGKRPEADGTGLSWALDPGSDMVLQLHLHPSGKPEEVRPAIGFYFTDEPPTNTPFLLRLPEWRIDIPAAATNHVVENSYVLPVTVDLLRVSAHAHYLGKDLQGYAMLPDGRKEWLLRIKNWDFNWQGDYRYARPVRLPKGTRIVMHFTYDNSEGNVRNPNHPPRRVRYGAQTTDEMAQLTFQVLARTPADRAALAADSLRKMTLDLIAYQESLLLENPDDARAHAKLGQALMPLGRFQEALEHLRAAIRLNPDDDKAHYDLGTLYLLGNQLEAAQTQFEAVLRLNPGDYQAHGNLGNVHHRLRHWDLAEFHFSSALRLNPDDAIARRNLELLQVARRKASKE